MMANGDLILGVDASTAVTGLALVRAGTLGSDKPYELLTHVDLAKLDTFWEKVDCFADVVDQMRIDGAFDTLKGIFIEESLQAFRPGLSSASTLMTLAKWNGIVCFILRQTLGFTPVPLACTSARKSCGIVIKRDALDEAGKKMSAKVQTFRQVTAESGPLRPGRWSFETKRSGAPKDHAMDTVDAFVIAHAGAKQLQ